MVIAIIAVLAALLAPAMRTALARANATWCMSNMRQLGIALSLHATDRGDFGHNGFVTNHGYAPFSWNQNILVGAYLDGADRLRIGSGAGYQQYWLRDPNNPISLFICPAAVKAPRLDTGVAHSISYNINATGHGAPCGREGARTSGGACERTFAHPGNQALEEIEDPTGTYLLYDMRPLHMYEWNSPYPRADTRSWSIASADWLIPDYHLEGLNFIFSDFHAELINRNDVAFSKWNYWMPNPPGTDYISGGWTTVMGD